MNPVIMFTFASVFVVSIWMFFADSSIEAGEVEKSLSRSFLKCIGATHRDVGDESDPQSRSCVFNNVCYSDKKKEWLLFNTTEEITEALVRRELQEIMTVGHSLSVPMSGFHYEKDLSRTISFKLSKSSRFKKYPYVTGATLFIIPTLYQENPGHAIFDSILSRWNAMLALFPERYPMMNDQINVLQESEWRLNQKLVSEVMFDNVIYLNHTMCFESLVIGGAKKSGMEGNIHSLSHLSLQKRFLYKAKITLQPTTQIKILFLKKLGSAWGHMNVLANALQARKWIPHLDATVIEPTKMEFIDQIEMLANTHIVISTWGGVSMMNFVMPVGAVEIIATTWSLKRDPYGPKLQPKTSCPDRDRAFHQSYSHVTTLRYCVESGPGSDGWSKIPFQREKFLRILNEAIAIVCQRFSHLQECHQ